MSVSASRHHVNIASYQNTSALQVKYQDQAIVAQRTANSTPVWNSRTVPLCEVLHGQSTPVTLRDTSADRRDDVLTKRRYVYIHSISPAAFAVADGLRDAGSGLAPTGRRYAIPVEHGGWFELLSQDGHAAAPFTSVHELMKVAPERCLVRRTIAANDETGQRSHKIAAGETVTVEGSAPSSDTRSKRLRCRVDRTGETVWLSSDQRGVFSPVAGPTNVAGVHRMRSIVSKFRFPVVVRLITRAGSNAGSSTFNDSGSSASFAFRVIAAETEPAAYVVPFWNITSPSDANRKSLMMLPTSSQASSVLDSVARTTSDTIDWLGPGWSELQVRCDDLIKSRSFTAEITRLFPPIPSCANSVRRKSPAAVELLSSAPAATDEYRLLREIDYIYEAIKTGDRKNGLRSMTTTRRPPRRYRSMRVDAPTTLAPFKGSTERRPRSPARRSNTLDPFYLKQQQLNHDSSPTRMRWMTSHANAPPTCRRRSPPLQLHEPIYDELRPMTSPTVDGMASGHVIDSGNAVVSAADNGPCVQLADSAADNLRQVIKQNSTTFYRPQSYDGSGRTAWEMELLDNHEPAASTVDTPAPPLPVKRQQLNGNTGTAQPTTAAKSERSACDSRLTSSSSDDVTGNRKPSSSALGAMTSSLMRALRRTASKSTGAPPLPVIGGENEATVGSRVSELGPLTDTDGLMTASEVILPTSGKVTHF